MDFKTRISTALATGSLMFGLMAPAALAADLEISNNGPLSSNNITVNSTTNTTVNQTNNTTVGLNIISSANSGNNSSSFNSGNTTINTGNATSNVTVNVSGSSNTANLPDCGCNTTLTASIIDNGPLSSNNITVRKTANNTVNQRNRTSVSGFILSRARTGNNSSSFNSGNTNVTTRNATSNVSVNVTGGTNTLLP